MSADGFSFRRRGRDVTVHSPIVIVHPENLVLGSRVILDALSFLNAGKGLFLGNCIHVATMASIIGGGFCVLEDFVGVCAGARIITGTDEIDGQGLVGPTVPQELRSFHRSFVVCGKHAFLGTNCVVHPGVTIGEGTVVSSGAVVTKDLEPWGIYQGAPARRVKDRPRERMIELERRACETLGLVPSDFTAERALIEEEIRRGSIR